MLDIAQSSKVGYIFRLYLMQIGEPTNSDRRTKGNSWIKVKVVNYKNEPVRKELYKLHLPDGSLYQGRTDNDGCLFVSGISPGICKIELPNARNADWKIK